jgi:hypothetical protein
MLFVLGRLICNLDQQGWKNSDDSLTATASNFCHFSSFSDHTIREHTNYISRGQHAITTERQK